VVVNVAKDVATSAPSRRTALRALCEVVRRFPDGFPLLDALGDLKAPESAFKAEAEKVAELERMARTSPACALPDVERLLLRRSEQLALEASAAQALKEARAVESLPLRDELKKRKAVLRRLAYTDQDDVVQLKGRVACEISTCEELVATELLLGGAFNALDAPVCAALVSCLVFEEGVPDDDAQLPSKLKDAFKLVQDAARRVAEVQRDADLDVDVDAFVKGFNPALMEVVHMWCSGAKFREICDVTEVYEGSIVRAMRRETELLRQLCTAAKVVGDAELESKFERAIQLAQRDIAFSASLYL